MWDVARSTLLATLAVGEAVYSTRFAPDGSLAILTRGAIRFWPPGSIPRPADQTVRALTVDADGSVLTLDSSGVIERRDSILRTVHQVETGAVQGWAGQFSPDRKFVVTSGPLSVREVETGRPVANLSTLGFSEQGRRPVALEFDGRSVLAVGGEVPDGVWPVGDGARPTLIGGLPWGQRSSAVFGRSDREIVLGREDGGVSVLDISTWNQFALRTEHDRPVRAMVLSPDRKLLATGDDNGVIALWDTTTWQRIGELRGHTQAVTALEFSPDSSRLASGGRDSDVIVWDVGGRALWATLDGHTQPITPLAWRPDGTAVVSAGADAMTVWPLDARKALAGLD